MRSLRKAFRTIDRAAFVLPAYASDAPLDVALPIGFGHTDLQPSAIKPLLEWLEIGPGDRTLEIGAGSGWTTALLAYMAAPQTVYALAGTQRLADIGREHCAAQAIHNVTFFPASHHPGLAEYAPYDRIIVTHELGTVPEELIAQLNIGGKMIVRICGTLLEVIKPATDRLDIIPHRGFALASMAG
jgi:protein-L-isoaspartate(D-aspartate) O-methyltransferase